jgi:hypothetical protein
MLNVDAINNVIASIRGELEVTKDIGFNMDYPLSSVGALSALGDYKIPDHSSRGCGTVACIAGHAAVLALNGGRPLNKWDVFDIASDYLGIRRLDQNELFYAYSLPNGSLGKIHPEQAIRALEILRDTGEIDWQTAISSTETEEE